MTTTYIPTCPACRDADPATFYKACGGCQARRAVHMAAYHSLPKGQLPVPSVDGPETHTCPWCGLRVTEEDDCPRPAYHCQH